MDSANRPSVTSAATISNGLDHPNLTYQNVADDINKYLGIKLFLRSVIKKNVPT